MILLYVICSTFKFLNKFSYIGNIYYFIFYIRLDSVMNLNLKINQTISIRMCIIIYFVFSNL